MSSVLVVLTVVALVVAAGPVRGATLLDEDFEYGSTAGTLTALSGGNWVAHSGATGVLIGYQPTSLTLAGYAYSGDGGAATLVTTSSSAEDANRAIGAQSGVVYASALVNVSSASTGTYFLHFSDGGTSNFRARVGAADVGGALRFGVSSNGTPTYPEVDFSFNTTYLVVFRYDVTSGDSALHVLSSVPTTEPGTPLATGTMTPSAVNMSSIAIRQGSGGPTAVVDGIRVGTSWEDTVVGATQPNLSVDDVSASEGNSGTTTFTFTVSLDAPAGAGGVTFDAATADGTATAGSDYVALPSTGFSIAQGGTSTTVEVTVNGDTSIEGDETFYLNLANVGGATVVDGQGLGTILNDDAATPTLSIGNAAVTEGDAGTVNLDLEVTLSGSPAGTVTVDWATVADGTAIAGADFTTAGGTLTFVVGDTTETASVPVIGDLLDELDETFTVQLSNPTGGAVIGDGQATGTILDDDPMPDLSAQVQAGEVIEGMTAVVWLALDPVSGLATGADYQTVAGTATAGTDFVAASGAATIPAGATAGRVLLTTLRDGAPESAETFTLDLSNPANAVLQTFSVQVTVCDENGSSCLFGDSFDDATTGAWDATSP